MNPEKSPEALALEFAGALEARGIDYALSGALALAYWGVPRATKDVDVALYAGSDQADLVADAVEAIGAQVDRAALRSRFVEGGTEFAWYGSVRLDLFAPCCSLEGGGLRIGRLDRAAVYA